MKQDVNGAAGSQPPLIDRADERLHQAGGVKEAAIATLDRIRAGDLGALPVVVGLAVIWTAFQIISPVFLSANNLVNLLYDSSTIGVIALGIVCILMVGEIDLSVGSTSGFASAVVGSMWVNHGLPVWLALCAAVLTGVLIGLTYSVLFIRFGMPSFIATLAGLLAILGLQLYVLGDSGSINLPYDTPLVTLGQTAFMPHAMAYVAICLAGTATFAFGWSAASRRRRASLSSQSLASLLAKTGLLVFGGVGIVAYLDRDRGVPWMFAFFALLVTALDYGLTRTRWGRWVKAVGGNRETARRAGINVPAVYTSAFVLCSVLAAVGGVMSAARLASASQQAGTGDVNLDAIAAAVIGGTSLFGGRGSAYSALLGIVVIQSIASGLTLLDLSSSLRYMITGAVLAVAVIVDSLARRSRISHGRA